MAFYFDQTRCTGCYTCVIACKDWHDVEPGPASWRRVITIEKEKFPKVFVANLSTACYHCALPQCVSVCPANAITKREEDGVVVVDRESCMGIIQCGGLCKKVCPYDAPQFGSEADAKMQKCNFCLDRLSENKSPICVAACPMRALDAGPIEQIKMKYGDQTAAEGFAYSTELKPSIIFKPKLPQS